MKENGHITGYKVVGINNKIHRFVLKLWLRNPNDYQKQGVPRLPWFILTPVSRDAPTKRNEQKKTRQSSMLSNIPKQIEILDNDSMCTILDRRCLNDQTETWWPSASYGHVWPADKGQRLFVVGLSAIFSDLFPPHWHRHNTDSLIAAEDRLCK